MFFNYLQNGGEKNKFIENRKLAKIVIIEANSAIEANQMAEQIGIYFDGVLSKKDKSTDGDRWQRATNASATKVALLNSNENTIFYKKENGKIIKKR